MCAYRVNRFAPMQTTDSYREYVWQTGNLLGIEPATSPVKSSEWVLLAICKTCCGVVNGR
jgi:hypothetical protein